MKYKIMKVGWDVSEDISKTEYCQISLNEESQKAFAYAIKNQYWYQMYIDDLPIWGNVHKYFLYCMYQSGRN